jgi:putative oxygen-independent coproporphyrinogen III oxidase
MSARADHLAFYIHIPYCVKRCGYCDFNTYTPAELQIQSSLETISHDYIDLVLKEIERAAAQSSATFVPSIFFGGGTPTLMAPADLARVIGSIQKHFTLTDDCEITIEANPDTVNPEMLSQLLQAGFNRISLGMQSAVPHVLEVLDRTHNPANVEKAVLAARAAGFKEVSVDLIYGTPGESMQDWEKSIDAALALPITHISAYALIVEEGTKLASRVKRGEIIIPDDDETADKYILADNKFRSAGMDWYELSNWSKPGSECKHNLYYWYGENWWGAGPGAHSHMDGRRWWNVKHPGTYKEKILSSGDPTQESENLSDTQREEERLLLNIRLPGGIAKSSLTAQQLEKLSPFLEGGHVSKENWGGGKVTLTQTGRLLADRIVRDALA